MYQCAPCYLKVAINEKVQQEDPALNYQGCKLHLLVISTASRTSMCYVSQCGGCKL